MLNTSQTWREHRWEAVSFLCTLCFSFTFSLPLLHPPTFSPFSRVKGDRVFIFINNYQVHLHVNRQGRQEPSCSSRVGSLTAWWSFLAVSDCGQPRYNGLYRQDMFMAVHIANKTVCEKNVWEHLQEKNIGTCMCCCSNYQGHNV